VTRNKADEEACRGRFFYQAVVFLNISSLFSCRGFIFVHISLRGCALACVQMQMSFLDTACLSPFQMRPISINSASLNKSHFKGFDVEFYLYRRFFFYFVHRE